MPAELGEWLNLVLRWTHLITGIAWIGSSFFFNWLDSHLTEPEEPRKGIEGELWMVHSGGFYQVEKMLVAPEKLPKALHWFKWEAGFTWISGFFLLVLIYYLGADVYLVDPSVAALGAGAAVAIGIATLVITWFAYDLLWLSPLGRRQPNAAAAVSFLAMVLVAYLLGELFSGRGAYIHVGAMMGTVMAANVWVRIIPAQRQLVEATKSGGKPDAQVAANAKQRSLHNNYMTLPVVFIMVSSHYPGTYGHPHAWLVLAALTLIGAAVRHFFNLRNKGRTELGAWYLAAAGAGMAALIVGTQTSATKPAAAGPPVAFAEVGDIVARHCLACHSAAPTHEGFDAPPKGVRLDRPELVRRYAPMIYRQSVASETMPLGNETGMTREERETLGRWILQGAHAE